MQRLCPPGLVRTGTDAPPNRLSGCEWPRAMPPELMADGGRLAIEIADSQRDAALQLARANPGLTNADVLKDHEGLWRVLVAERAH